MVCIWIIIDSVNVRKSISHTTHTMWLLNTKFFQNPLQNNKFIRFTAAKLKCVISQRVSIKICASDVPQSNNLSHSFSRSVAEKETTAVLKRIYIKGFSSNTISDRDLTQRTRKHSEYLSVLLNACTVPRCFTNA